MNETIIDFFQNIAFLVDKRRIVSYCGNTRLLNKDLLNQIFDEDDPEINQANIDYIGDEELCGFYIDFMQTIKLIKVEVLKECLTELLSVYKGTCLEYYINKEEHNQVKDLCELIKVAENCRNMIDT